MPNHLKVSNKHNITYRRGGEGVVHLSHLHQLQPMPKHRIKSESSPPLQKASFVAMPPSLQKTLALFFTLISISHSLQNPRLRLSSSRCNETCGGLQINFPFYINSSSCGWSNSTQFQLLCLNSTTLYLSIGTQNYHVLEFYSDGILVDFPGISGVCRSYNDLSSFGFSGNPYLSISSDNVLGLYDCEDSSLCKANCEGIHLPGCHKSGGGNDPSCCYPLSDYSVWSVGSEFSVFEKYECRGFSCWAVPRGTSSGKRGVKLEWAWPRNLSNQVCHPNAHTVNATAVKDGIRCACADGFSGDGFANGTGCLKSCLKDGEEAYGKECEKRIHKSQKRIIIILAGSLASILAIVSFATLFCLIKKCCRNPPTKETQKSHFRSRLSFQKACRGRLFTLADLEQATNGFSGDQKLIELFNGSVYSGLLEDGSHVAVHRVHCQNEKDLLQVLTQIELLSTVLHRHIARILGCCIESGYTPMVVYEFPENGTLAKHIRIAETKDEQVLTTIDWYKRLTVAAQTANTLAFLQHEISTPVYHFNLKTSCVFLDQDFSVKLACFELISPIDTHRNDVYDLGMVLLEIISGSKHADLPAVALQKIRDGRMEEIVDPLLYFHEQPVFRKEQMEIMADVATRCLLFGNSGKLKMEDVARELVHLAKESMDGGSKKGPALEEALSDSTLLQMATMSPENDSESDSAYFSLPFKKLGQK